MGGETLPTEKNETAKKKTTCFFFFFAREGVFDDSVTIYRATKYPPYPPPTRLFQNRNAQKKKNMLHIAPPPPPKISYTHTTLDRATEHLRQLLSHLSYTPTFYSFASRLRNQLTSNDSSGGSTSPAFPCPAPSFCSWSSAASSSPPPSRAAASRRRAASSVFLRDEAAFPPGASAW